MPHLLKTARNCWANSFVNKYSRALWISAGKGYIISMYVCICMYVCMHAYYIYIYIIYIYVFMYVKGADILPMHLSEPDCLWMSNSCSVSCKVILHGRV